MSRQLNSTNRYLFLFAIGLLVVVSGCSSVLTPISGLPVTQLPEELRGIRRSEFVPVPVVMLARPPQDEYAVDDGDVLSVYIPGVMPFSPPNEIPAPPPVIRAEDSSGLPPTIGYPIPVQGRGYINLPLVEPLLVRGLTVDEIRKKINDAYRQKKILREEEQAAIVSVVRKRTNNILVIRSNSSNALENTGEAAGYSIDLPFHRSDVLNALTATGGMPGFNEKNEITIFRTSLLPYERRAEVIAQLMAPCSDQAGLPAGLGECCFELPANSGIPSECSFVKTEGMLEDRIVIRIPLRLPAGQTPQILPSDIELRDGDVLVVESRETEFFYTGGELRGGQYPLPRDYDLDVLGAIAIAGTGLASQKGAGGGAGGGLVQGLGGPTPTLLYIIRKLPCGRTYNIAVDVLQAMNDSSQNILVQPGDTLILRYKPHEELANFGIGTFFTFGIRELFRND